MAAAECEHSDYVPHGIRSSFHDLTSGHHRQPRGLAEMALAHTIENNVAAAYRGGDLFEKEQPIMQERGN